MVQATMRNKKEYKVVLFDTVYNGPGYSAQQERVQTSVTGLMEIFGVLVFKGVN